MDILKDRIDLIIGILTFLSGFFGIPKIIEAAYHQIQISRIRKKVEKLAVKLNEQRNKKSIRDEPVFDELKILLWLAKDTMKNKEYLQKQLNKVIGELYGARMDEDIQELRTKFQDYFEFDVQSWAYIAIANMDLYHMDGLNDYKINSLEACKECIKRRANYGTPWAVMLIIQMIDYEREKQINKEEISNILTEINSGADIRFSSQTYIYLLRTRKIKDWKIYIDHLYNLFPDEMNKMEENYKEYIKYNPSETVS